MAAKKNPNFKNPRYRSFKRKRLSLKQSLAIDAYFANGGNIRQAMLSAGYAIATASKKATDFMDKELVQAEMERRKQLMAKKHKLDADWVVQRLMAQATASETLAPFKKVQEDGTIAWDFTGATQEELAVISDIAVDFYTEGRGEAHIDVKKFKVKVPDAMAALNALARHLGLYNDSLEVKGSLAERIAEGRAIAFAKRNEEDGDSNETVH